MNLTKETLKNLIKEVLEEQQYEWSNSKEAARKRFFELKPLVQAGQLEFEDELNAAGRRMTQPDSVMSPEEQAAQMKKYPPKAMDPEADLAKHHKRQNYLKSQLGAKKGYADRGLPKYGQNPQVVEPDDIDDLRINMGENKEQARLDAMMQAYLDNMTDEEVAALVSKRAADEKAFIDRKIAQDAEPYEPPILTLGSEDDLEDDGDLRSYPVSNRGIGMMSGELGEGLIYEGDASILEMFEDATLEEGGLVCGGCLFEMLHEASCGCPDLMGEAVYQGKKVKLNKPTRGDVKKFKVYVNSGKKDKEGRIKAKKVNFGHGGSSAKAKGEKTMKIRKNNPDARANFRARHNCDTATDNKTPRYWSCKKW